MKRKDGKPNNPRSPESTVETMGGAATRLGVDREIIKLAKQLGCPAFKPGGRINVVELEAYVRTPEFQAAIAQSIGEKDKDWDERLKRAKALREEHKLSIDKGDSWPSEIVRRCYTAGDSAMMGTLRKWLESDLPPLIEGKSAADILAFNSKFLDELTEQLRADRLRAVSEIEADIRKGPEGGEE